MATRAKTRKVRRRYTLSRESVEFICEERKRLRKRFDSEALDQLLQESREAQKLAEIDAAYKAYYDNASDEELQEEREWAEMAGPSMFADIPE